MEKGMEALKTILTRRSVRSFTSQLIDDEIIENILQAAMSAPSASNEQPWHFMVIRDRKLLDKIPEVHQHSMMCAQAPLAIIPCVDMAQEKYRDFWVQDMSAAAENILLAVRALGLGAVWLGVYPNKDRNNGLRKLLNLPESVVPFCIIPIGYTTAQQTEATERYKKDRVHYDKW